MVCVEAYPAAGPYAGKYHKTTCAGCLDLTNKTPHVADMTCARFRRNLSQRRSNAKAATAAAAEMRDRMLRSRRPPVFDESPGGRSGAIPSGASGSSSSSGGPVGSSSRGAVAVSGGGGRPLEELQPARVHARPSGAAAASDPGRIVAGFAAPVVSQRFLEIRLLRRRKRSRQTRTTFSATACCFLPGPGDLHRLQRRLRSMRTARVSYPSLRRPLRWPCRRRRLRARSLFGSLTGSRLVVSCGTS